MNATAATRPASTSQYDAAAVLRVCDAFFVVIISRTLRLSWWWRGTVVERRSLAGELSLSCARPAADG